MGLVLVAVVDVAIVGCVVFVVLSQPRPVWRDAAEHSRRFWFGWVVASVVVGIAPAAAGLMTDWAAAIWLTACCAFAAFQPAMWADVLEVRRDVARRRHVLLEKRRQDQARIEAAEIGWPED
jgi:hypothetical protein